MIYPGYLFQLLSGIVAQTKKKKNGTRSVGISVSLQKSEGNQNKYNGETEVNVDTRVVKNEQKLSNSSRAP